MSKLPDLVERMRAARGVEILTAREWLDALGIGGGVVKLGLMLSEGIGTRAGPLLEYRLLGRYDGHVKRWQFAVWTDEEVTAERERRAAEAAAKQAERQAELQANWEAKQTPEQRQAREPFAVKIQAPPSSVDLAHSPAPEPAVLTHTRVDGSGRLVSEAILGRDGMPVRAYPEPSAPKPEARKPAVAGKWTPGCGRPYTVADAVAQHEFAKANPGNYYGLADDNGAGNVSSPEGLRIGNNRRWSQDL